MNYSSAFFIGRFQPFHLGHKQVVLDALEKAERLVVVLGSCYGPRTPKNPFTSEERKKMFELSLMPELFNRISFIEARDYHYNDHKWLAEIRNKVYEIADKKTSFLTGHAKDFSSYYLKLFPEVPFIPIKGATLNINATDIRTGLFEGKDGISQYLDVNTYYYVLEQHFSPEFVALCMEYNSYQVYKDAWKNSPYPPVFLTVDSVVEKNGHILLVERGKMPGKGLYALPGGFVNSNERLLHAAIRETCEETGYSPHSNYLKRTSYFDYPARSLRGRTVTHAFYFKMHEDAEPLPLVAGADDARKAFWMAIPDIYRNESRFFEDHAHVISFFLENAKHHY